MCARRLYWLGLALVAGFQLICKASPLEECPVVTATGPDVEAVREMELRGARVNMDGWSIADAHRFFAPDYVSIQPDGTVRRLDSVLAVFVDGRSRGWARSFDVSELDIHVYHCTAAVVVGKAEVRASAAPPDSPPWRIRYLNVWRKQDGRWLNSANQFTRMIETANARPAPLP